MVAQDPVNSRPDLVSKVNTDSDATHPSDHNAVAIVNPGDRQSAIVKARRTELDKREQELEKGVRKGKGDHWAELLAKRSTNHSVAFMCPVHYGTKYVDV